MENSTLQEKLELLLKAYTRYFDIKRDISVPGGEFPAAAYYHLREENYIATKAHTVYATEQHEYAYFYLAEHLDAKTLQKQIDLSREFGLSLIKPHKEHMLSYVSLVVLAETVDPEAKKLLTHYRFHKNYWLTLHGWMEYHIAAVDFSSQDIFSNPAGKDIRKILKQVFQPKAN
jgi:hypothetical protein